MHSFKDAFGHILYDFMQGESVKDVIERDDGFITVSIGPEVYFTDFEDWRPAEQQAVNYASGRVLDIGCGAARQSPPARYTRVLCNKSPRTAFRFPFIGALTSNYIISV